MNPLDQVIIGVAIELDDDTVAPSMVVDVADTLLDLADLPAGQGFQDSPAGMQGRLGEVAVLDEVA